MTVSNATCGAITQAPGNPGALQRSHSLSSAQTTRNAYRDLLPYSDSSPARITQNSPESLRAPVAGKVLFRALEETGASSSKVRHVFDIVESGNEACEKSYQITMSDGLRDSVTMKLEMPEGERLESVREKLKGGGYKIKVGEDKSVCHLVESVGLKGGAGSYSDGETPLHIAAFYGKIDAINTLIKAGAVVDQLDKYGDTPLHIATIYGKIDAINTLIKAGAVVDQLDKYGNTPLHIAAIYGKIDAIHALINAGAVVDQPNKYGETPLDLAQKHGRTEIVRILEAEVAAKHREAEAAAKRKEEENYYLQLGFNLKPGTPVNVNGQPMSQQACFLKVLRLNPKNDQAFVYLGTTFLRPNEKVTVNGKPMSQRDCYREALRLNPNSDLAYEHLGNTLQASEDKVRIGEGLFGEKITKQACYLSAITKNPRSASAYQQLGLTMQPNDTVPIFGKNMTKQECFERAVELGGIFEPATNGRNQKYREHQKSAKPGRAAEASGGENA